MIAVENDEDESCTRNLKLQAVPEKYFYISYFKSSAHVLKPLN